MRNRINAGAVLVAGLQQAIEGSLIVFADREARRPVAAHFHPGQVFQQNLGQVDIGEERVPVLVTGPLMAVTVAGQLMPILDNAPDQLRIAFGDRAQREDRTEWHRVILWSKLGELAGQYLKKGSQVFIEGRLQTRSWDDKDGQKRYSTEIVATSMQFLGGRSDGASRRVDTSGADMPSDIPPPMCDFGGSQEDDIPF